MMKKNQFLALLGKKLTDEISEQEIETLNAAMDQSEEYQKIAATLEQYFNQQSAKSVNTDRLKHTWLAIKKAEEEGHHHKFDYSVPKVFSLNPSILLKIAAVLLVFVVSVVLVKQFGYKGANGVEVLHASNQKTFKLLNDGTKIWLNKHSSITYNQNFGKHKREISLKGEAYFDVAKNAEVPLFIHVGPVDIEVKGTAFNVDASTDSIQIALVRGLIQVTNHLAANQKVLLKPNQKLMISERGKGGFTVLPANALALFRLSNWTTDTLTFHKEKLIDLVPQLERKYNLKIEIQSAQIKEKRFSGTLINERIDQALEALRLSYPLTYTINGKLVIIKD